MIGRRELWLISAAVVAIVLALAVIALGQPTTAGPGTEKVPHAPLAGPKASPPSAAPAPAPRVPAGQQFGADVNRVFEGGLFTPAQMDAQLAALRKAGATVARTDALWEATEPAAPAGGTHRYDWTFDDGVAGALARNGLRWLPVVDYSAPWAESAPGHDHSPPSSPSDFAAYAAAVADRYGPGGAFWAEHRELPDLAVRAIEIWNEPDNPTFWMTGPDPARYAALYLASRDAIVTTNPHLRVLVGGLWHVNFLAAMLVVRPDLVGHIDGISVHPYGGDPEAVLAGIRGTRRLLKTLGLGSVPLYVTEFGWTTSPPGARDYLPAGERAAYIAETLAGLGRLRCGIAESYLYTWVTEDRLTGVGEQWYGIYPPGGGGSRDSNAFAAGIVAARAPGYPPLSC